MSLWQEPLTQGTNRYCLTYRAALGTQMVATRHVPFVAFLHNVLRPAPLNAENRTYLENCAKYQALAKELTNTDRDDPSA